MHTEISMSDNTYISRKNLEPAKHVSTAEHHPHVELSSFTTPGSIMEKTNGKSKTAIEANSSIDIIEQLPDLNTDNEGKKGSYSHFKVIRANKDVLKCPQTDLPMIDLRGKTTNQVDPAFHGLITDIRGHYEPLITHVMGKGSFGEVFKGLNLQTNRLVAIKKLKIFETDEIFPITAQREIMILKKMEHANVVTLSDVIFDNFEKKEAENQDSLSYKGDPFMTEAEKQALKGNTSNKKLPDRFFYMVLPYMVSDLAGVIHNPHLNIDMPKIKNMMQQILQGLNYVHKMKYFHRDVKTANILIDQYGVLKVADFGLSRIYYGCPPNSTFPGGAGAGIKFTPLVVTRWYRAPELVMFDRFYTTAIDIWGTGCILGEFFIKKPILQGKTDIDQGHLIFQLMGKPDYNKWPTLKFLKQFTACYSNKNYKGEYKEVFGKFLDEDGLDLFSKMLCLNPYERITAGSALQHDWFKKEPLPSKSIIFEKIMESHESDIEKFDRLKREMDMQKNASKNLIEHIHNDVTPESQISFKGHSNSFTKLERDVSSTNRNTFSGSRFNAASASNKVHKNEDTNKQKDEKKKVDLRFSGSKKDVELRKVDHKIRDEPKRYENKGKETYSSRFERNRGPISRFEAPAYSTTNIPENPRFESRNQRDKQRKEISRFSNTSGTKTDESVTELHPNRKSLSYAKRTVNIPAASRKREHEVDASKENDSIISKKRKEEQHVIPENNQKQISPPTDLTVKSKSEIKGSIKGKIDDMYD